MRTKTAGAGSLTGVEHLDGYRGIGELKAGRNDIGGGIRRWMIRLVGPLEARIEALEARITRFSDSAVSSTDCRP